MSTERLKRSLEHLEHRMRPVRARKWTVIHDDEPGADDLEREAHARGDNVIRVVRTDTPR